MNDPCCHDVFTRPMIKHAKGSRCCLSRVVGMRSNSNVLLCEHFMCLTIFLAT